MTPLSHSGRFGDLVQRNDEDLTVTAEAAVFDQLHLGHTGERWWERWLSRVRPVIQGTETHTLLVQESCFEDSVVTWTLTFP